MTVTGAESPGARCWLPEDRRSSMPEGREALTWLIDQGFVHVLFCGNALPAHDMEADLYGTSLGYGLSAGRVVPHGHEHHLPSTAFAASASRKPSRPASLHGIMASCVREQCIRSWPVPFETMGRFLASSPLRWRRPRCAQRFPA